jgi:hypothetical protein
METESLKSLAYKVLHGNRQGNQVETEAKINGNFRDTCRGGRETSETCQKTMFAEYRKFILKATGDQTNEHLKIAEPGRLKIIKETMTRMDDYFNKRDQKNFMRVIDEALKTLEQDIN